MLNVSTTSWHIRLFFFCEMVWKKFMNTWNETSSYTTDICTYIRTIFLLAPAAVAINLFTWFWVIYVFLYKPFVTFGAVKVGYGLGAIVVFIGIIAVVVRVGQYFGKLVDAKNHMKTEKYRDKPQPARQPTFFDLLWQYVVSAHNKVCVIIKLIPSKESLS